MSKHGDRVPEETFVLLRGGWYPIVDKMFTGLALHYPDVRIRSLIARRGWLHIDYALPTNATHDWIRHSKVDKWFQGFITANTAGPVTAYIGRLPTSGFRVDATQSSTTASSVKNASRPSSGGFANTSKPRTS